MRVSQAAQALAPHGELVPLPGLEQEALLTGPCAVSGPLCWAPAWFPLGHLLRETFLGRPYPTPTPLPPLLPWLLQHQQPLQLTRPAWSLLAACGPSSGTSPPSPQCLELHRLPEGAQERVGAEDGGTVPSALAVAAEPWVGGIRQSFAKPWVGTLGPPWNSQGKKGLVPRGQGWDRQPEVWFGRQL